MILTGIARLGRDAEVKYTQDGTAVANLALAYNYGKKDGQGKRPTQWVDGSLWGERAEKLAEYLTKGTQISVVLEDVYGHQFKKGDGSVGFSIKGRVMSLEFAGSKPAGSTSERPAAREKEPSKPTEGAAKSPAGRFDDMDDDIPF